MFLWIAFSIMGGVAFGFIIASVLAAGKCADCKLAFMAMDYENQIADCERGIKSCKEVASEGYRVDITDPVACRLYEDCQSGD